MNSVYQPSVPKEGEPYFTVLGRDKKAASIARLYGYLLMGQVDMAKRELDTAISVTVQSQPMPPHDAKVRSCFDCGEALERYYRKEAIQRTTDSDNLQRALKNARA